MSYSPWSTFVGYGRAFVGRATHDRRPDDKILIEEVGEDSLDMGRIIEAVGFSSSFRYEKFRSEWSDSNGHVVIDETPIGNFGEIEGQAKWIDATAKRLNIPVKNYLKESYAELFAAWKRKTKSKAKEMTFKEIQG